MRSHVTFMTRRFNQTEVKPHFINECCFGEDALRRGNRAGAATPDAPATDGQSA